MAKIDPGALDPRALLRARGVAQAVPSPYGWIVRKWMPPRGKAKTPYDQYRQAEFGIAARWASSPLSVELRAATNLVKGSEQVPRDALVAASFGNFLDISLPGIEKLPVARHMTNNPQWFMDLITTENFSVVWRKPSVGWIGTAPDEPGQALFFDGSQLLWQVPSSGPGASWSVLYAAAIAAPTAAVDLAVSAYTDLVAIFRNVTGSAVSFRQVIPSVDNGATYPTASGDYQEIAPGGTETARGSWCSTSSTAATARTLVARMFGINAAGVPKLCQGGDGPDRLFVQSLNPITNIRLRCNTGNMTGGSLFVIAR